MKKDKKDVGGIANQNAAWANYRGSWTVNLLLLFGVGLLFLSLPGLTTEMVWSFTTLTYNIITFIMFHGVIGTPFDYDQNQLNGETLWEQFDDGAQYTPTKKFLVAVPIILFLVSTHYTHYNTFTFLICLAATVTNVVAKSPLMYKVRLFGFNKGVSDSD
ncbi:hypothetical protein HDU92_002673 [Lobulomyces angularis]|nr:hypothetical protein HDU92_002673 [Lobulomyces angularis]